MNTLKHPWDWQYENDTPDGPCILFVGIYVPVCSFANPIAGKYLLSRRTEGWQLAPVVYDKSGHGKTVRDMPFYLLVCASDELNERIEKDLEKK